MDMDKRPIRLIATSKFGFKSAVLPNGDLVYCSPDNPPIVLKAEGGVYRVNGVYQLESLPIPD